MFRKKIVTFLTAGVLAFNAAPAFAATDSSQTSYPVCPVEGCELTGSHQHGADTYCGHYYNDGHDYHVQCSRTDCVNQEIHEHDDICYYGHCGRNDYNYPQNSVTYSQSSYGCGGSRHGHHSGRHH